jgi:hypothetical protein
MDVQKLVISHRIQRLIHAVQTALVDLPFDAYGKTEPYTQFGLTWEGYTLMARNGWQGGDLRKPVTAGFQEFFEQVYCPVIWALLFGERWGPEFHKHYAQFKSCTIKVCENTGFYGNDIFHMHVDGKIGLLQRKNFSQKHMSRLLFSIVTDALEEEGEEPNTKQEYGTTAFPIWQPKKGFRNNHEFHKYMQTYYLDRGLENSGLTRPHYEIPENLIYRAVPGEVLIHQTHAIHGCQPIHSEPNPCPDRHLYVFDWNNIVTKDQATGKYAPSVEVPETAIIDAMMCLSQPNSVEFQTRLKHVVTMAQSKRSIATKYPDGETSLNTAITALEALIIT